jgi:hypothetical protein
MEAKVIMRRGESCRRFASGAGIRLALLVLTGVVGLAWTSVGEAQAAGPMWGLSAAAPTRVAPGLAFTYRLTAYNLGDADTDGTGALDITLPAGVTGASIEGNFVSGVPPFTWTCSDPSGASTIHCDTVSAVTAGQPAVESLLLKVTVDSATSGMKATDFHLSGGGAASALARTDSVDVSTTPEFGIAAVDGSVSDTDGAAYTKAGGHPAAAAVTFSLRRAVDGIQVEPDGGDLRNARVSLPPGLIGNPVAVPSCSKTLTIPSNAQAGASNLDVSKFCSASTIVGTADITVVNPDGPGRMVAPVFNLEPPPGMPAQFGFSFFGQLAILDTVVRSDGDYGIDVVGRDLNQAKPIVASSVSLWGVPADHSHDNRRCLALTPQGIFAIPEGAPLPECDPAEIGNRPWLAPQAVASSPLAFLTNPTVCTAPGVGLETRLHVDPWDPRSAPDDASFISHLPPGFPLPFQDWGAPQGPTECDRLPFDPSLQVRIDTTKADAPSGLAVDLSFPQQGLSNPTGRATAHLKRAQVTLPEGMTISPSAADGLVGCSDARANVGTLLGADCPEASKIGTVEASTPLLDEKLTGGVYVGTQESDDPQSGKMFRMFLALNSEERGIRVKLPGEVRVDPSTGTVEATFDNNPQVPVSTISLRLKGGPRAPLATPFDCGDKTVTAVLESWSGATAFRNSTFHVQCPGVQALAPSFRAGTTSNLAGKHTRFALRVERPDGQKVINGLSLAMPTGLLATLKGVPRCPGAAANAGACPETSRVGTATVGAGPGSNPFFLQGGVYLTDAYKNGPFGLAVAVRAKAGPFDLGTVVVRQQLLVDPIDAHVTVVSDPLPTILKGVPIRLRSLNVDVDRDDFVLNPTSCAKKAIGAAFSAPDGSVFNAVASFGAANCAALPLKPKLKLALTGKGQTTDGRHPGVKAVLTQRAGDANLKEVSVKLPISLALDPGNAQTLCEFSDGTKTNPTCPRGSIVGHATARTPVLNKRLRGPVYFVKNVRTDRKSGRLIRTLPMLVIALRGEGVALNLKGTSKVSGSRLVNTFGSIPDAPVSRFDLTIDGGRHGILVVSGTNICRHRQIADARIDGQNHKPADRSINMKTPCRRTALSKRTHG